MALKLQTKDEPMLQRLKEWLAYLAAKYNRLREGKVSVDEIPKNASGKNPEDGDQRLGETRSAWPGREAKAVTISLARVSRLAFYVAFASAYERECDVEAHPTTWYPLPRIQVSGGVWWMGKRVGKRGRWFVGP